MSPKSKYYPLFKYLSQQPDTGLRELSFAEIEAILGKALPNSALTTRAWWANSQSAHAQAWQEANWLVDDVDFKEKVVVFRPARITYRLTPIRKSQSWTGEQVKALREFAGWSQQELARRLAVRQQTITMVRTMEDDDLDRTGRHPFHGQGTLERFIVWAYEHARLHMADLQTVIASQPDH